MAARIREYILQCLKDRFGQAFVCWDKDEEGFTLTKAGAAIAHSILGIEVLDQRYDPEETGTYEGDDGVTYYQATCYVRVRSRDFGSTVEMGWCGNETPQYKGVKAGNRKAPKHEQAEIRKKAFANAYVRAVQVLSGLVGVTDQELRKVGINPDLIDRPGSSGNRSEERKARSGGGNSSNRKAQRTRSAKSDERTPPPRESSAAATAANKGSNAENLTDDEIREKIRAYLGQVGVDDDADIDVVIENLSQFVGKDGKVRKGVGLSSPRLKDKWLRTTYGRLKSLMDSAIEAEASGDEVIEMSEQMRRGDDQ
ncbi:MAG: hypothetical protein GF320_14260 [Armatimonadia bacterium]|nr:hypothetical protein [Armatimonadia bacterium]